MQKEKIALFWFRRDLRLEDNIGLFQALNSGYKVVPIFIFDKNILEKLPANDARVSFIHNALRTVKQELNTKFNSRLGVYQGTPKHVFNSLVNEFNIAEIYTNHDYEPYAIKRDIEIRALLNELGIAFKSYKDQVIFEKDEIVKADGLPYVVYTPYMRKWKEVFRTISLNIKSLETYPDNFYKTGELPFPSITDIGFEHADIQVPDYNISSSLIKAYEATRNLPAVNGTSKLGPHLRFGTVSIRMMIEKAIAEKNETFWNELIWREFFMQILWHFPKTATSSFKEKYDRIVWRNNEVEFKLWCEGKTGFPLVDAGMRELNETGFMHNRVRMLVGSFLCKHLLIDWRWGEAYFAEKLLDYEMASNIGNWQWVAGCGVDAAPYFRIFNPTTQIKKFDAQLEYINAWVKDLNELTYPTPIVDHKLARERCLETYKKALN